jgi:glycosyltransferase involved in cell wall biosynthesis
MKVLMVGTERRLFDTDSAARARILKYATLVDELHIIALTTGPQLPEMQLSPKVWLYPTNSVSPLLYPIDAVRFSKVLKERGIDLVSAQDPFESGLAAYRLARKLRAKFHVQVHTDMFAASFKAESFLNKVRARIARYLLPKARGIRVVSKRIADSIKENGVRLKSEPIVLPIFVDVQKMLLTPSSTYLQEMFPKYDAYVLMVSRLEKEKNFPLAFQAFSEIAYSKNAALVIIGSGSEQSRLEALARDLNIKERVKFVGWQEAVTDAYRSATVFLASSDYEGYGLTFIEAAASHLPIVTTDVGIVRDFFGDDAAYISPVGDEQSLGANLEKALGNRQEAEMRAARAAEIVKNTFGNEEEYLQQYRLAWEKAL